MHLMRRLRGSAACRRRPCPCRIGPHAARRCKCLWRDVPRRRLRRSGTQSWLPVGPWKAREAFDSSNAIRRVLLDSLRIKLRRIPSPDLSSMRHVGRARNLAILAHASENRSLLDGVASILWMVNPMPAEIGTTGPDTDLVARLLRQQAPHLAPLRVRPSDASGSSNAVFRLDNT